MDADADADTDADADADAGGIAIALLHLSAGALKMTCNYMKILSQIHLNFHTLNYTLPNKIHHLIF